jgi:hypothetical protein
MSASFRIVDYNYAAQSNVTISASSEKTNFPATNAGHEFRSKVWRSNGYYVVTSSNNKVNFRETSLGPELTASVAVGNYTLSAFLLAIKSAMDSATVNARTYTVTRNATSGRFTITGSVYLELLFSTGTNAATSIRSIAGFGANDYTGAVTYEGPISSWHTEEGLVIDLQSSEEIDTVAVLFDPRIGVKLSDSALIYVQASATNAWVTPAFSQAVSIDNTWPGITLFLNTAQEYRFWRIKIVDPQNAYGYVELGTVVLGKYLSLARCPDNGFDLMWDDGTKTQVNDYGNTYADIYPQVKEMTFNFNILTYDQQKILEGVYRRLGNQKPVFVSLDPGEELFDKDHFYIYGRMSDKFTSKHVVKSYFSTGIKIREAL